jgi:hypothetical protein
MSQQADARRACCHALLWCVLANAAVSLLIGYQYLRAADLPDWSLVGFSALALVAQLSAANLVVGLFFLGLSHLGRGYVLTAWLAPFVLGVLQVLLYVDAKVYGLFRFHLNGLVIGMATARSGWDAMQVSRAEITLGLSGAVVLLAAEWVLFLAARRRFRNPAATVGSARRWVAATVVVVALWAVDHIVYAVSDVMGLGAVTASARLVPLYRPFTIKTFVGRFTHQLIDRPLKLAARTHGALVYPRVPLTFAPPQERPDIVEVVIES